MTFGRHLLGYLAELGMCRRDFNGLIGVGWDELHAWAGLTGTPLTPWEAVTLAAMSAAYAAGITATEKPWNG